MTRRGLVLALLRHYNSNGSRDDRMYSFVRLVASGAGPAAVGAALDEAPWQLRRRFLRLAADLPKAVAA